VNDFAGSVSRPVTAPNGGSLPEGITRVRIGCFDTASQSSSWASDIKSGDPAKFRSALQSFIPLGEDVASPALGSIVVNQGPRIASRAIQGVVFPGRLVGGITSVQPVAAPPNTRNPGGVPAGSRIFLLVSDGSSAVFEDGAVGIFSADVWLMPDDPSLPLLLNTTFVDSESEVFRGSPGSASLSLIPAVFDTDDDGLPDSYEISSGLDPYSALDRDLDLDGDGRSNYLEFLAGTRPNDPASRLQITAITLVASNKLMVAWDSVPGNRYQIQISPDPGDPEAWTALGLPLVAIDPSTSWSVTLPEGHSRHFLRIAVVPSPD
jgi:hypothetical protein